MPINPERMKRHPGGGTHSQEWKAFRAQLIGRADNRCEGTPQHPTCRAENGMPHPETGSKVVLTIAHMDHDESHADPDRCRALCQRCHLRWDAGHHSMTAAKTRRTKSIKAQQAAGAHADAHLGDHVGHNLACWCPLDGGPFHADVLLELARIQCKEVKP